MEQTKERLIHDYNLAVASYNKADYSSFFRNVRPTIENLCQYLIFDIWGEEEQVINLINGDSSIIKDRSVNRFVYCERPAKYKPTGRALPELFLKVYYCKHSDIASSKVDEEKKRLKRALDSCCAELCRYYSIASEIGAHAGRTNLDVGKQACSCAAFIVGFLDFAKSYEVVSKSAMNFVDTLIPFAFGKSIHENDLENPISQSVKECQVKELELGDVPKLQKPEDDKASDSQQKEENSFVHDYITSDMEFVTKRNNNSLRDSLSGNSGWDVSEETMDDDQLDLIEYTNDKSMLVAGCAGSGKSVIAMHKAEQLFAAGHDVILIAYTKSLNRFMENGSAHSNFKFFYYHQWKKLNMPMADYVIVDEIQDFTQIEVKEFIHAAKKHFLFFGDTAQSIYGSYGKKNNEHGGHF